jgi:hypothetical protein
MVEEPDESNVTVAVPQPLRSRCRQHLPKLLVVVMLVGLAFVLFELNLQLRNRVAKNEEKVTRLKHILKLDETSFSDFQSKVTTAEQTKSQFSEMSAGMEELKLELEAMKIAIQFLTEQLNKTRGQNAAMFRLVLKEANLTLCSDETDGEVTVPTAGVFRLKFSALVSNMTGQIYKGVKLFSLQRNGEDVEGGEAGVPGRNETAHPIQELVDPNAECSECRVLRILLLRLEAGDTVRAAAVSPGARVTTSRLCLTRSGLTLPEGRDSVTLTH